MAYKAPADLHPPRKPPQAGQPQTIHAQEPRLDLGAEGLLAGAVSSNRRRSSTKVPGLKRAVSSPNVRGEASGESMPLSPLDKKRNKLGYHRTAVACGMKQFLPKNHVDNIDKFRSLSQKKDPMHSSHR